MSAILTPPQIADRWGVSPESVLGLLKRGALKGFTTSPPTAKRPRWRVTLSAVEAYEAGEVQVAPSPAPSARRRSRQPSGVIEFFK